VECGLCGAPRIRTGAEEPEPELPPELEFQLAGRRTTEAPKRSFMLQGCLGTIVVAVVFGIIASFCLRDATLQQPGAPVGPVESTPFFTTIP
jgi:hypothetical protein